MTTPFFRRASRPRAASHATARAERFERRVLFAQTVQLTLTIDPSAHTWAAYEQNSDPAGTSGLHGLSFDVVGAGGATVTSSAVALPAGSDADLGATGFTVFRDNGAVGVGITAFQANALRASAADATVTNVFTGLGNTAGTIHTGSGTGTVSVGKPALLATGTYAGDAGTITISGDPTLATLLPASLPPPAPGGAPFATFSPDEVAGQTVAVAAPQESVVQQVYVRGSSWTPAFKTYLAGQGLGDATLGYRVDDKSADDVVPWLNVDEIVLRYAAPPTGGGIPTAGTVVLDGVRGDYAVSAVTQADPQAFVLELDRNFGNLAGGGENGDRVRLTVPGGGPAGATYARTITVLQGDVDKSGSVLANDFSDVKKKFFKSAANPDSGDAGYTVFHDVDGSGSILANDFSEVKKRFFDNLPAAPAGPAIAVASITRDLFSTRRVLG